MPDNAPLRTARPVPSGLKPVSVIPREWKTPSGELVPGIKLQKGRSWIFVPASQLRGLADIFHDRADELEEQGAL